ncbi:hypothetical protein IEO21_05168 [Rhodonia placenta]|uniref:endo-polygalacturonase n=1 Tax=Rhodonia placenta TaxID=104341 RepID=A0A8H7P2D6_9APHY|nr:hypothetical protein IEO21_05168 [Postia placenta]
MLGILTILVIFSVPLLAVPSTESTQLACSVNSVASASDLSNCSYVVIESFTVPDGGRYRHLESFPTLYGAFVTMAGEVTFANTTCEFLLLAEGTGITFDGAGNTFNGNGAYYWDGLGTNGGKPKPHPFMRFVFKTSAILNSPAQAISVEPAGPLTINHVTVNNTAGNTEGGHNTDGFDVSASDLTIMNSVVENQDDCVAINAGSNILFEGNYCSGGHGMSIGSISSGKYVSGVTFIGNTVVNSMYGTRIKVDSAATSGAVSNVTYTGNNISGCTKYGVLVSQSYPEDASTPGNDTTISNVNFIGSPTTVEVDSNAERVTVDCGNCYGTWDWSELTTTGGEAGTIDADKATVRPIMIVECPLTTLIVQINGGSF